MDYQDSINKFLLMVELEQMNEFADVRSNKNDIIGWGIYIPEKESVVVLGRKEDETKVRKLLSMRQSHGRKGEVLVPIFRPHGGLTIED